MSALDPAARRKPYKLKTPITRDSFLIWTLNQKSYCRQFPDWIPFLPGGTRSNWTCFDDDPTRGLTIIKKVKNLLGIIEDQVDEDATNKLRNGLEELLECIGTYCPENFLYTVVNESTSFEWILTRIKETFKLDTKGIAFLSAGDIQVNIGQDGQTYQQLFQAVRERYCSSLLKKGDKFKGKLLERDETLTPFGENTIVEKWLDLINPGLKAHVVQTRGSLFNDERPTLADNQRQLSDQMDTLLQEVQAKKSPP